MRTSMEERKSNSRFSSDASPMIIRRPIGEHSRISASSNGVYSFSAFFASPIPRRRQSSTLPDMSFCKRYHYRETLIYAYYLVLLRHCPLFMYPVAVISVLVLELLQIGHVA